LTLIAAVLPGRSVSTHTVFCLRTSLTATDQHYLCALFNSFILNYLVRLRVTTHVTTGTVERLPVPTRERAGVSYHEIAAIGRLLAAVPDPSALARLQARVAGLYQLTLDEFEHVLSTFPLVPEEQRREALRVFATETQR
jgi:hypothetical protein